MDELFNALFTTGLGTISVPNFIIGVVSALALGIALALIYMFKSVYTKSFVVTLAILPAVVAIVIMMVSGSLGAGVAAAGTFSLVRFRSIPGTAKEIGIIFLAMAVGLVCGMGYPLYGLLFVAVTGGAFLLLNAIGFGEGKNASLRRVLRITVPEDLEYGSMFDDLFEKYTTKHELSQVKTTNLGSLNRLTYNVTLKKAGEEKAFIDELRCRNGNLEINLMSMNADNRELL
ncbi:MAG: DUF4956 domain-containing protein [Ruminococcaceae bacterium]|nr:DUF4956 domain-containing protein [Oscillospiraceae bacterium]